MVQFILGIVVLTGIVNYAEYAISTQLVKVHNHKAKH